ncbi:DNA-binding protein [Xylanimonas protaetiae]|uniref:DNA-binding protein n=2 Tax=Xylanimonas protaetiae TaxID=2509457 RepID=A0A4P6F8C3_9MICO|nr:DNA-binding protein [Xylanimonas protaetiae]
MGSAEVTALLGVSKQRTYQLTGRPDFPAPVAELKMGKVWRTADVMQWAIEAGRAVDTAVEEFDPRDR